MAQSALTENIIFVQTDILRFEHTELCGGITFWRHIGSGVPGDRFLRDQYTTGMNAQVTGEVDDACRVQTNELCNTIGSIGMPAAFGNGIDLRFGQTENFSELAYDGIELKRRIRREQSHMFAAMTTENIIGEFIAVFPGKIEIEIGRIGAKRIDETLEVEIEIDRIHIGDAQTIRDNAVRPAAAADIKYPLCCA